VSERVASTGAYAAAPVQSVPNQ